MNLFKKQSAIGINISDYSIEALQLSGNKEIFAYNRVLLEKGIVEDGRIIKKEELAQKLQKLLASAKPNPFRAGHAQAVLSLPESKTFIHYFEFSKSLRGAELKKKVLDEASRIVPFEPELLYWDYMTVPDGKIQHVLYAGALREVIEEYRGATRAAGIIPVVMDAESFALGRALFKTSRKKASFLVVDIGARTTILGMFGSQGIVRFSSIVPVAGNHFTAAIAKGLGVQNAEAEKMKRKGDAKIFPVLELSFQNIIQEIKDAIAYYEKQSKEKVQKIVLAGGSSLMPGLGAYMGKKIGLPVRIGKPYIFGKGVPSKRHAVLFAAVIGLGLRGISEKSLRNGINLLPGEQQAQGEADEEKEEMKLLIVRLKKKNKQLVELLILLGLVSALMPFAFWFQNYEQQKRDFEQDERIKSKLESVPFAAPGQEVLFDEENTVSEDIEQPALLQEIIIQDTPTGSLNVRKGPGFSFEITTKIAPGEKYVVVEESEEWYNIVIDKETTGWIFSQYAEKTISNP